jgi:hypothetical protein
MLIRFYRADDKAMKDALLQEAFLKKPYDI